MKILFVIPSFGIGGTTTSLINLISKIDKTKYDLYIYAINNDGALASEMALSAELLNQTTNQGVSKGRGLKTIIAKKGKVLYRLLKRIGVDLSPLYFAKVARSFDSANFDCVIAFQEGLATMLVSYCRQTKKIAWIRSEYRRYLELANKKPEKELYKKYDKIVSVSNTAINQFLRYLPQYKEKSTYLYNLLNKERVLSMANETCEIRKGECFTIVSLGRIDRVKRFSDIPIIAHRVKCHDVKFRWLIIGGAQETEMAEFDLIKRGIAEYQLEDTVFLVGNKQNPYCYLNNSNLLVCLSESETFNHTFGEARLLGIPVLSVNYESASEMLGVNNGGLVVERDNISDMIVQLINNYERYACLCQQAQVFKYDNESILRKFYNMIDEICEK